MAADKLVKTWHKRVSSAIDLNKRWMAERRVDECYTRYDAPSAGKFPGSKEEPSPSEYDEFGQRKAQINKIHPEVRNNIPSLYYYRPFARLTAAPEMVDDPGSPAEDDTQLLQDTVNHLIRDPQTMFRESTFIGLKEAHWAMGVVEVGYSAEFADAPQADRPPLKENKDTKTGAAPKEAVPDSGTIVPELGTPVAQLPEDPNAIDEEVAALKSQLRREVFFVKHIPANHVLISVSDMPILHTNDWVGYWEDVPLEDVKRSPAYKNTADLKANCGDPDRQKEEEEYNEETGSSQKIRLYKIWDLRSKEKLVIAEGHDKFLLRKRVKRCPLKFLRFDIDPYHFYPRPLILSKLDPQIEYNDSREYLRKVRKGTVPRFTYDEDAIDAAALQKLETGLMGTYVPRKVGTSNVIEPIQQPSFSENAIQTLTLSDKEFMDVGGVGPDARVASTKTATQAKIAETKNQVQDSFDRLMVAEWLASIARELLALAIENMSIDRWIAINVSPDSQYSPQLAAGVKQTFDRINADILSDTAAGISWDVTIDLENLSPVSQEEKKQKFFEGLTLMANPGMARLLSVAPPLLDRALDYIGIDSAKDKTLIEGAVQQVVQMEAMLASQSQNASTGVSPQPGGGAPGAPKPAGGPQPGGPPGPGASMPKPPQPPQ